MACTTHSKDRAANASQHVAAMVVPKLSIILVTKNRYQYLPRFFANMREQMADCGCSSELIVIDGGSTDGAVEIIKQNSDLIAYWISEPDRNCSEAVNKGIRRARGEFIKLVSDDDIFWSGAFNKLVGYLDDNPKLAAAVFHSNYLYEDDEGNRQQRQLRQMTGEVALADLLRFPYSGWLITEGAIFRSGAVRAINGYDEKFHLWAFWDFFLRLKRAGFRIVAVPEVIIDSIGTPISDGSVNFGTLRTKQEFDAVLSRHGNFYIRLWHSNGGDLSPSGMMRRTVRSICVGIFGRKPKELLRMVGFPIGSS